MTLRGKTKKGRSKRPIDIRGLSRILPGGDKILLLCVLLLAAYGTVMVWSAGYSFAALRYGDSLYFIKRNLSTSILFGRL